LDNWAGRRGACIGARNGWSYSAVFQNTGVTR
jgi:hypothetical protein